MKRVNFIVIILAGVLILPAQGQTWTPHAIGAGGSTGGAAGDWILGQPFAGPGDQSVGLGHFLWIPLDTTFRYQLGEIPDKSVFHHETSRFRIYWADHPDAVFSYRVMNRYDTTLSLAPQKDAAVFEYRPLDGDLSMFAVEFMAVDGDDTAAQVVDFTPVPVRKPEQKMIRYEHDPLMFDTVLVMKSWKKTNDPMNYTGNDTVVRIDVIGKTVVFRNGTEPFLYDNLSNLEELNVYATTLVIADSVHIPQTRVNLYCENLVFSDPGPRRACINTTPRAPLTYELVGLDAQPFHAYVDKITAEGRHLRFFINGGRGSASMMKGVAWTAPAGGGDGGDFYSNRSLNPYVSQVGGMYGEPHNWDPVPSGPRGSTGTFHFDSNTYKWLHPHAVRLMLQYAREHYICGQEEVTYGVCNRYTKLIGAYRGTEEFANDSLNGLDLDQLMYSFSSLRDQLDDKLDYFGNPWGWAPLLSFEANLINYEREMEYAIRVLYLSHWMTDKAADLAGKQEAAELLKSENIEEIMRLKEQYQEAYLSYSPNLLEFKTFSNKLDSLTLIYNQKIESLLIVAKRNVATSWENILRQVGNVAGQVCKLIPHPAAQAIGTGLSIASSLDYDDPLSMKNLNTVFDNLSESLEGFSGVSEAMNGMIGSLDPGTMEEPVEKQSGQSAREMVAGMSPDDPLNIGLAVKELTFPDDMVKAEFEKLKSQTPILKVWTDSMEVYSDKKGQAAQKITFIRFQLTSIPREMTKLLLACDAMDDVLLSTENIVDPRAMAYLNEMKNSAWERMLRYHYYMALAYQYRFLKPYEFALDMRPLFESFDTLARQDADLSPDQYNALLPIFQNQLKQISDEIYTVFNDGTYNEHNTQVNYTLNADQLETLNNYGELKINIWNSGKIPLEYMDCRITDISLNENSLDITTDTILSDATLTLLMAHSGNSTLIHPKTGEHLAFAQYNKDVAEYYNTNLMSPLGWAEKYFFDNGQLDPIPRSLASQSLIRKILSVADDQDLLIFTRPAADAEIKIVSTLHTGEQENMQYRINSLTLDVRVDFQTSTGFTNVLVNSSNGLLPLIQCSRPDESGRDYGWGNFTRTYSRNAGTVVFTAPKIHGIYAFEKWKKTTNSVTEEIPYESVTVNPLNHNWITAVYRLNVPRLDVPDTVYAGWLGGQVDIAVKNSNVCYNLPMEWFSETQESWVTIKEGTAKGIEEGTISLILTGNPDAQRNGELMVYALDAVNPERRITIVQREQAEGINSSGSGNPSLRIYPNPASREIYVELPAGYSSGSSVVSIITVDGKCVFRRGIPAGSQGELAIPLDEIAPGLYVIKAEQGQRTCMARFAKY